MVKQLMKDYSTMETIARDLKDGSITKEMVIDIARYRAETIKELLDDINGELEC